MNHRLNIEPSGFPEIDRRSPCSHKLVAKVFIAILAALLIVLGVGCGRTQDASAGAGAPNYDQLVSKANSLLKDGKLDEAQQVAEQAVKANPANYLAYAIEAKITFKQGHAERVKELIDTALTLAPDAEKDKVRQLAAMLNPGASTSDTSATALSDDDQLKHDGLMRIVENTTKASDADERKSSFRQFLTQSVEFADAHPDLADIWVARAYVTVELDYPGEGWLAGRYLQALRATHRDDSKIREELLDLESKGWLGEQRTYRDWSKWNMGQVQAAANAGDAECQLALGGWCENGTSGFKQDYTQAIQWYRKAADQEDADGENNIGRMFLNGWGAEKDYSQALVWFRKAANQSSHVAEINIGDMYEYGLGVKTDFSQAVNWFRKAADQGNSDGEQYLGVMYLNGMGVHKDYAQAISLFRKSADQGNSGGEALLGVMYQNGFGVDKDYSQAISLFRKSADQGGIGGEFRLGVAYENGWGVDKSQNDALTWYRKAAAQGDPFAQAAVTRLNPAQ